MKFLSLLAAPLLAFASPLLTERQADRSVDTLFKGVGKIYFGAATEKAKLDTGKTGAIVQQNFGQVTNEYLMKWDQTEPSRGQFNLGPATNLCTITDKADLTSGKIRSWDVVNEVIDDSGNMKASSHFFQVLGEDFIKIAFNAARQADPAAKLYINDYNLEDVSFGQFKGIYSKVQQWKAAGVPIDGIGSQTHLGTSTNAAAGLESALRQLATIVTEVAVTELDACYHVPTCVGVTTWEVRDEDNTANKALFKVNYDPKDAYYQIADELKLLQ
ncbi:glycoside hydrolase [Lizonia empirigonia]|nr:glycoside hydrolase [Lizonia empirigonia]